MQLNKGLIPKVPGKAPRTLTSLLTCLGATSGGGGRARVLRTDPGAAGREHRLTPRAWARWALIWSCVILHIRGTRGSGIQGRGSGNVPRASCPPPENQGLFPRLLKSQEQLSIPLRCRDDTLPLPDSTSDHSACPEGTQAGSQRNWGHDRPGLRSQCQ